MSVSQLNSANTLDVNTYLNPVYNGRYHRSVQTFESGIAKLNLIPPPLSRSQKIIVDIFNTNFKVTLLFVTGKCNQSFFIISHIEFINIDLKF